MEDSTVFRAQMGNQVAFQQLIETYNTIAWRTARVLLPDRATVEDVMQEVWLDVWRGLPRFQPDRQFRPWLLTIVANRCRMATRSRKVSTMTLDIASAELLVHTDDVLEHILHLEEDAELQLALATLSVEQQRVLQLRFFADLDLGEIALITSTPLGTVKSRLHRGLNSLRIYLQSVTEACKEKDR
jgi:RNA polymerase sigma-70 factor, ECF subfamily